MKINTKTMAFTVIGIFVVGIGAANLLGYWKTTGSKTPVTIKEGEFAGLPNPSDIRGSYTWNDVAVAFNFDVALALEAFGAKDAALKVNTLEAIYEDAGLPEGTEIGTDSVRLFVSLLVGLPHTPEEGTILPASVLPVLRANGKADPAKIEEVAARAFSGPIPKVATAETVVEVKPTPAPAAVAPATSTTTVAPSASKTVATAAAAPVPATPAAGGDATVDHVAPTGTVTGKTTFKDLLDQGVTEENIKSVTGGKMGPASAVIRDWAAANGLTFSELKEGLQAFLSK